MGQAAIGKKRRFLSYDYNHSWLDYDSWAAALVAASKYSSSCPTTSAPARLELLSNLVFEDCWSCGDLVRVGCFNSVFEGDACDDFGEIV
ncbi:MAG: hypothetical protein PF483_02590, partial [Halothiobacillus sp.]|nr:hypothetical protein [Halothiobacillus sp.]